MAVLKTVFCTLVILLIVTPVQAATERGIASVYSTMDSMQNGTKTASGIPLRNDRFTAAHRTLPFGTRVRVTNGKRSVVVIITDRGPFMRGRIIDLTPAGAKALRFSGLARVKVEVLAAETRQARIRTAKWRQRMAAREAAREVSRARGGKRATATAKRPQEAPSPVATVLEAGEITPVVDAADSYLCQVYHRLPVKRDNSGDFSWKDRAAAKRMKMGLCQYVIKGMHRDLRESLYHLGQRADQAGIRWSFLSGFRDNYRQRIAAGLKARECGSRHGGSCVTKGYGDGQAADLWVADKDGRATSPHAFFALIDRIGRSFGVFRPMKSYDPAHVQVTGRWHVIAQNKRAQRLASLGIERIVIPYRKKHRVARS